MWSRAENGPLWDQGNFGGWIASSSATSVVNRIPELNPTAATVPKYFGDYTFEYIHVITCT